MNVTFFTDSDTGEPHIFNHGVTEAEVRQILAHPGVILKGRKTSRLALGQTVDGRYLKIVYSKRREGRGVFVVTAYELRGKELSAYRRRRRKSQ
jgi:uncharacterized DUF497 family protein